MLRCQAHTAVKSDEDDEQGNHVLNYSDTSQGIMGNGNCRAGGASIHIWDGGDLNAEVDDGGIDGQMGGEVNS